MPGTIVFIIVSALFGGAVVLKEKDVARKDAEKVAHANDEFVSQ